MNSVRCRIEVLGQLRVSSSEYDLTHFRTMKSAELLGRLALFSAGDTREALANLLWPDADNTVGRNRLKQEICSLRRMIEVTGESPYRLIDANRDTVLLRPAAYRTDVADFRSLVKAAGHIQILADEATLLERAAALNKGEFLVGHSAKWIAAERQVLNAERVEVLARLARVYEQLDRDCEAVACLGKAIEADPESETLLLSLMEILERRGEPREAVRRFRAWRDTGKERGLLPPSHEIWDIARRCGEQTKQGIAVSSADHTGCQIPRVDTPVSVIFHASPSQHIEPPAHESTANLPFYDDELFGVEDQIALLCGALADPNCGPEPHGEHGRLVTITGKRGSGKTRLALAAAHHITRVHNWRADFIDISRCSDIRGSQKGLDETVRRLHGALPDQAKPSLLILDGCDLGPACVISGLQELMWLAAGLTILATSTFALGIDEEHVVRVLPLDFQSQPEEDISGAEIAAFDRIGRSASVRMFVNRARTYRPDFQLTRRNSNTIAAICRKLEGLPLAIELAAAHVNKYGPRRMLQQLESTQFDFLVTTRGNVPERQRKLRS